MSYLRLDNTPVHVTAIKLLNRRKFTVDTSGIQVFLEKDLEHAKKYIGTPMFSMVDGSSTVCAFIYRKSFYDALGNKVYPTQKEALRRKQIEIAAEKRKRKKAGDAGGPPKKRKRVAKKAAQPAQPAQPVAQPAQPVAQPVQPVVELTRTYTSVYDIMWDVCRKIIPAAEARAYVAKSPKLLDSIHPKLRAEWMSWCAAHGYVFNGYK